MNNFEDSWRLQVSPGWKERERRLFEERYRDSGVDLTRTERTDTSTPSSMDYTVFETQFGWEHWQKERLKVKWQNTEAVAQKNNYEEQPVDFLDDLFRVFFVVAGVQLAVSICIFIWVVFDPNAPFR